MKRLPVFIGGKLLGVVSGDDEAIEAIKMVIDEREMVHGKLARAAGGGTVGRYSRRGSSGRRILR